MESQVDAVVVAHGKIQEPGGAEGHPQVVAVVASEVGPARDEALSFKRAPAVTTGGGGLADHAAEDFLPAPGEHVVERGAEAQRAPEAEIRAGLEGGEGGVAGGGRLEEFPVNDAV